MDPRKLIAVFAVALMAMTALAVLPESDASGGGNTMEMMMEVDGPFDRSVGKVYYYYPDDSNSYDVFYTDDPQDDLFQKYIDGESDRFLSETVREPVMEERYYTYYVGGYNYQGETKFFERAASTKVILRPGTIDIRLMSDVEWVKANIGWGGKELSYGNDLRLDAGLYGGTLVLSTDSHDFKHLQKVTVRFSDPSVIPERHSASESLSLNTGLSWYHSDLSLSNGYCFGDLFMFASGTPGEERFVDEVVLGGKADFERSDYGILEKGEFPSGSYSVYRAVQDPTWAWSDTISSGFGDAGVHSLSVFKAQAKPYTMFSKANTDLTVCIEFDESKFRACVDVGFSEYDLNSGYRYVIPTSYASEVKFFLISLDESSSVLSADVRLETTGMDTETGSPAGMAGLCVLLSALVFVVLFLSNRKPHW